MRHIVIFILFVMLFFMSVASAADSRLTKRIPYFSNNKVNVWTTIVYPNKNQILKMHRHEYDRILVALNDGVLKIVNDKKEVHYVKLKKDKAYYFKKDIPGELHSDENMSHHPIKVLVIELKA